MREMDYPTKFKNILSYGIIFIASDWKQSKFSSLADWLNKLWYVYHLEYYSVMRKNGEDIYAMRSDFQNIKAKWRLLHLIYFFYSCKKNEKIKIITARKSWCTLNYFDDIIIFSMFIHIKCRIKQYLNISRNQVFSGKIKIKEKTILLNFNLK